MVIELHLTCEEQGQVRTALNQRKQALMILTASARAKGDYVSADMHDMSLETCQRVIEMIGMARPVPAPIPANDP